jgi:hypothetical protein
MYRGCASACRKHDLYLQKEDLLYESHDLICNKIDKPAECKGTWPIPIDKSG